jgi:hypothetical protein
LFVAICCYWHNHFQTGIDPLLKVPSPLTCFRCVLVFRIHRHGRNAQADGEHSSAVWYHSSIDLSSPAPEYHFRLLNRQEHALASIPITSSLVESDLVPLSNLVGVNFGTVCLALALVDLVDPVSPLKLSTYPPRDGENLKFKSGAILF